MTHTDILREVCLAFGVTEGEVLGRSRKEHIRMARHAACWFCRHFLKMKFEAIGTALGGKDHGTALLGVRRVEDYLKQDDKFLLAFANAKAKIVPIGKNDADRVKELRKKLAELLE